MVLYLLPVWMRHVAPLLMLLVFPLLLAAYLPGRIKTAAKHPMLLAVKVWATAHLPANGNVADVLLFGGFLAWAVADRDLVEAARAAGAPGRRRAAQRRDAVVAGLALYAVFVFGAHAWLIGVSPI